ncbi:alkaline phosphatase family protein, partial [Acidobacteriota bacterium]
PEKIFRNTTATSVRTAVSGWLGATAPYEGISPSDISTLSENATEAERCAEACRWLRGGKYRLVMVYFTALDEAGHKYGPRSEEAKASAVELDSLAALIAEAAGPEASILVVSDHGMTEVERCLHLYDYLKAIRVHATPLASGGTANLYLKPGQDLDNALTALRNQDMFDSVDSRGIYDVFTGEDLPEHYRNICQDRSGDIVLVGHEGSYFREHNRRRTFLNPPKVPGMHGFDPASDGMAGIFIAFGPGIKKGVELETARCVDIYPTACRLLGIDPAQNIDGHPIQDILKE